MKTKNLFTTSCSIMLFTLTSNAQCPAEALNYEGINQGKKVVLLEIDPTDDNYDAYNFMIGQTRPVGPAGLVNIGSCWYMGEITDGENDVFFLSIRVKAAAGEKYEGAVAVKAETKSTADFPVGSRVLVHNIPATDKNSFSFYSDAPTEERGDVIEADLIKNANGTYSGCILTGKAGESYRTRKCFTECKVEKTLF